MKKLIYTILALLLMSALASSVRAADKPAAKPPKTGDKVIDFTLRDLRKQKVVTATARKNKVFLLKFGATWCGWCNKQAPDFNAVVKAYDKKVFVLDVDINEKPAVVKAHNKKLRTKYLTVLDSAGAVAETYGVSGIPVVIIADKEGTIVYRGYYTPFDKLKKVIDALVEKDKEEEEKEKKGGEAKKAAPYGEDF
ncbi:MAG: TlpA disulfide reductase family protein [Planctomycetota bacterium]